VKNGHFLTECTFPFDGLKVPTTD